MGKVVVRNRDKQEFQRCKGCHYYIKKSDATAECDICGKEVRHIPMEYHVHHLAPRGKQQNCLRMYERVATDTANGETEESGGRAQRQEQPPPPPMELPPQLPPFKPTDRSGNRRAKSPEVAAEDDTNMLDSLG